ncbi:hypothetical protein BH09VER1_BH09VER1_07730 [soil metagenome]
MIRPLLALFIATFPAQGVLGQVSTWAPRVQGLPFELDLKNARPVGGEFRICEGVALKALKFAPAQEVTSTKNSASLLLQEEGGGHLTIRASYEAGEDVRAHFVFENTGDKRRLLEVKFGVPYVGKDLVWWDGREETKPGTEEMLYERNYIRLPMSAVYDKIAGVAVGLDPHFFASMFAASSSEGQGGLVAGFRIRIVLDPGQKLDLPLYAVGFTARYGYLDAVQRLYGMYPDMFQMAPGVRRKLLTGTGGYLLSGKVSRHLQYEESRRYDLGWDWAYCPSQRPGDWYPGEKFWDAAIGYAGATDAHQNLVPGSLEDFRNAMRERFQGGWPATAIAYYTFPGAAEEAYIKSLPDGLLVDREGKQSDLIKNWVKAPFSTLMAYPWGNSYGNEVKKAIENIARDFQPTAMAFDEANRVDQQYGAGIEGDPARGWDDTGVFCSLQVAMGHISDFVHTLKVKGYTLGTIHNKPWTYCSATRADVAMHEWNAYEVVDCLAWMRLLMGHKPIVIWGTLNPETVLKWESLTPDQIREGVNGMVDFVRLECLRDGTMPMKQQYEGFTSLVRLMPTLSELARAGWQPIPAMREGGPLWLSRYGDGIQSYLVAGNPRREPQAGKVALDPNYLGGGAFLFSDAQGTTITTLGENGKWTLDFGTVPGHGQVIARALVQIEIAGLSYLTGATSLTDALDQSVMKARWACRTPVAKGATIHARLTLRLPEGATAGELLVAGASVKYTAKEGAVVYEGDLPLEGDLSFSFQPRVPVHCARTALLGFPFLKDGAAGVSIVLPPGDSEIDQASAQRIASYFDWYVRRQKLPAAQLTDLATQVAGVELPIVKEAMAGMPAVEIKEAPQRGVRLSDDGQRILIEGPTPEDREDAVLRLLALLDEKYPFVGVLPAKPIFEKAGLVGKALP